MPKFVKPPYPQYLYKYKHLTLQSPFSNPSVPLQTIPLFKIDYHFGAFSETVLKHENLDTIHLCIEFDGLF